MSWTLILAATAVIVSLAALVVSLQQISKETGRLRVSMRRARATGVAIDDLKHLSGKLGARVQTLDGTARIRRGRPRRGSDGS